MSPVTRTIYLVGENVLTPQMHTAFEAKSVSFVALPTLDSNQKLKLPCAILNLSQSTLAKQNLGSSDDIKDLVLLLDAGGARDDREFLICFRSRLESSTKAIESEVRQVEHLLRPHVKEAELKQVSLVLQEALRNALEHGNCAISSGEKVAAIEAEGFDRLVNERAAVARGVGKCIRLDFRISKESLEFEIEDEGLGFDWRSVLAGLDVSKLADAVSGRGLLLAQMLFDERIYNEAGNKVLLRKRLT